MPELPEVETIVRALSASLTGLTVSKVVVHRKDVIHGYPAPLSKFLPRQTISRIYRRAKRIVMVLDEPTELVIHLGMTGRLDVVSPKSVIEKHTHLRMAFVDYDCELRFRDPRRFGGVWLLPAVDKHLGPRLGKLGPEPLPLKPTDFFDLLQRNRQIKALLLDQSAIAGIGNIYCDEALHAAGIHPTIKSDSLDKKIAGQLLRHIKRILNKAIELRGSTLSDYRRPDGSSGGYQHQHKVYDREDRPCRNCGTMIERLQVAGRSSFVCPNCQNKSVPKV